MSHPDERVRTFLSVSPEARSEPGPRPVDEPPFRVLVLGDFAGRGKGERETDTPFPLRAPVPVDDPDEALRSISPTVRAQVTGRPVLLRFHELEDFHPDRVVDRVPELTALIDEIDAAVTGHRSDVSPRPEAPSPAPEPSGLLDAVVERTPGDVLASGTLDDLKGWIRDVVGPHLVEEESDDARALRDRLEAGAAKLVAELVRSHPFRRLERLWQGLLFLLGSVSSDDVRVEILDVSRDELEADLSGDDPRESRLGRLLAPGAGTRPPALVVGVFAFGGQARDVALLNRIAMVAEHRDVPWVSAGLPDLVGCAAFSDPGPWPASNAPAWPLFRGTPAARRIGLAAPRFLLRAPYGPGGQPCQRLPVDEVAGAAADTAYLWGNPAFVVAAALLAQFQDHGWGFEPSAPVDFGGTPAHALPDGRIGANATEAVWTVDDADRVKRAGLMPLLGFRGEARMRLQSLESVSDPAAPLAAWWLP